MKPLHDLEGLVSELMTIREKVLEADEDYKDLSAMIHKNYQYSAVNFLRYMRFRSMDLREIQKRLVVLGLSSLSHAERQVLANIENILYLLSAQIEGTFQGKYGFGEHPVSFRQSAKKLKKNSRRLFGSHVKKMGIMVTLPTEATDREYLRNLLAAGMNIARINTAHDDRNTWSLMITNLRDISEEMGIPCSVYMDLTGPKIRVQQVWSPPESMHKKHPRLHEGDEIYLIRSIEESEDLPFEKEEVIHFTCSIPDILPALKEGDHLWFNDGKIGGEVFHTDEKYAKIRITFTNPKGGKLRTQKGINLPDTLLELPSLSAEDLHHLDFICEYSDMVGYSFVQCVEDVSALQSELKSRGREDIGIIIKVENKQAFNNLPQLILKAMESPTIGVMTARGDLAVELGAERLAEVQEQIMWLCESALIPNIWATQVLESLTQKGNLSRAEITDAAMSVRAECVMLNKGPYIIKSLHRLANIHNRMDKHVFKKLGTLRKLRVADDFIYQRGSGTMAIK